MKISHLSWNFFSLRNQLIVVKVIYFANEITLQLLCSLPKSYNGFISSVGNQPNLIFDQLCNGLKKVQELILGGTSSNLTMAFYDNYKRNNIKKQYKT
jgi:hypothetical protein